MDRNVIAVDVIEKDYMEILDLLLKYIADPVCVLSRDSGALVKVNKAFGDFTGYREEDLGKRTSLETIVYKRDFRNISSRLSRMDKEQYLSDEVRILTRDRILKEAEVTIRKIQLQRQEFYIWTIRDISSHKLLERELRDKIACEQEKVLETARGILRVNQLLEKLHFLPVFFRELAKFDSLSELFQEAVRLMAHSFGYAYAAIFLIEGEYLKLVSSSKECALQRFHIKKQHRFAQVVREKKTLVSDSRGEYVIPIVAMRTAGVLQVVMEESERVLMDENLKEAHGNLLESASEYLGILIKHFQMVGERQRWKDPGSGAYNRAYFVLRLEEEIQGKHSFALVVIELDDFLMSWSEDADVHIMKKLSEIFHTYLPEDSVLARIADEKFGIIVRQESLQEAAEWMAEVKRKVYQKLHKIGSPGNELTFSTGIALCRGEKSVWEAAFSCLKAARLEGKDKIFYWQQAPRLFIPRTASKLK